MSLLFFAFYFISTLITRTSGISFQHNCDEGIACNITCSKEAGQCMGGHIVGNNATSLSVECLDSDSCSGLTVDCPIITNTWCGVSCLGDSSCLELRLNTQSASDVRLLCGDPSFNNNQNTGSTNENETFCEQAVLDGSIDDKQDIPEQQEIEVRCSTQLDSSTDACSDISIRNIGEFTLTDPDNNASIALNVNCMADTSVTASSVTACASVFLIDSYLTTFRLTGNGGIENSHFIVNVNKYQVDGADDEDIQVDILQNGYIGHSNITAHVTDEEANTEVKIAIDLERNAHFYSCVISNGDDNFTSSNIVLQAVAGSQVVQSTFIGGMLFISNGLVDGSTFESTQANSIINIVRGQWVQNYVTQKNHQISLVFDDSLASGTINAQDATGISLWCGSSDIRYSCKGLEVFGVPHASELECHGYGCYNLLLQTENGLSDWELVSLPCPCNMSDPDASSKSKNCLAEWHLVCFQQGEFSQSLINNKFKCEQSTGSMNCCNDDKSARQMKKDLVCTKNDNSELKTSTLIGIVFVCVVVILLCSIGIYWHYVYEEQRVDNHGYIGLTSPATNEEAIKQFSLQ